MESAKRIAAIVWKDLYDAAKNYTVLFALLVPVLLSIFFSYAYSQSDLRLPVLAYYEAGPTDLGSHLSRIPMFRLIRCASEGEARAMVLERRAQGALVVPAGFDAEVAAGAGSTATLVIDNSQRRVAAGVQLAVTMALERYKQGPGARVQLESAFPGRSGAKQDMLPVWLVFTTIGGMMVVSSSFMEERDKRTLAAILVTPAKLPEVLVGKALLGMVLTLTSTMLILTLNQDWSRGPVGNWAGLAAVAVSGALCFTLAGLLMGLVMPSQSTASALSSLLYLVLFLPVVLADMSTTMHGLARALPSYYLLEGFSRSLLAGAGPTQLAAPLAVLIGTSAVLGAGCWRALAAQRR